VWRGGRRVGIEDDCVLDEGKERYVGRFKEKTKAGEDEYQLVRFSDKACPRRERIGVGLQRPQERLQK